MRVTNDQVARNRAFQDLCDACGVQPTKRQASKFRRGKGILVSKLPAHCREQKISTRQLVAQLVDALGGAL